MADWQFWALSSWMFALLLRLGRVGDKLDEVEKCLHRQRDRERQEGGGVLGDANDEPQHGHAPRDA